MNKAYIYKYIYKEIFNDSSLKFEISSSILKGNDIL